MLSHFRIWLLLCGLANAAVISTKRDAFPPPAPVMARSPRIPTAELSARYELSGLQQNDNATSAGPDRRSILRARGCKSRTVELITQSYAIQGFKHQMSNMECGGGSIINSQSKTFQQTMGVAFGIYKPTKSLESAVEKVVPAGQYSVSHQTTTSTGYTSDCLAGAACIQWFQPWIMVSKVEISTVEVDDEGGLCSLSPPFDHAEYHSPMINTECGGVQCGTAGIWGQCYMMDFNGKQACDGPRPAQLPGEQCPPNFTPDFGAPHS